jgi:hypothetical protein
VSASGGLYLDACATSPLAPEALEALTAAQAVAWANPSSLHGPGLLAAESLERSRQRIGRVLGCRRGRVVFSSGGSESIHLALLGAAGALPRDGSARRVVISAVEHPATQAAAGRLVADGWSLAVAPVNRVGLLDLDALRQLLVPPTRLVSLIWGQSDVGALQPIDAIGRLCRAAGVLLHVDAVQVLGHQPIDFDALPVDLLSGAAHKLQGPRGVGLLLAAPDVALSPLIGGGGQEGGLRGGTEPVPHCPWRPGSTGGSARSAAPGGARRARAVAQRSGSRPLRSAALTPAPEPAGAQCLRPAPARPGAGAAAGPPGAGNQQRFGLQQHWIQCKPGIAGHGLQRRRGLQWPAVEPGALAQRRGS